LFRDIWGIISKHHCHLYRINGVHDHIHILSSLHPTVVLADFVKNIKLGSSSWIKESGVFPRFRHWQDGYGAFTASWSERNALIEYIKNQEDHHRRTPFLEEYRALLKEAGIDFEERYLT
jgi:putative transposase